MSLCAGLGCFESQSQVPSSWSRFHWLFSRDGKWASQVISTIFFAFFALSQKNMTSKSGRFPAGAIKSCFIQAFKQRWCVWLQNCDPCQPWLSPAGPCQPACVCLGIVLHGPVSVLAAGGLCGTLVQHGLELHLLCCPGGPFQEMFCSHTKQGQALHKMWLQLPDEYRLSALPSPV